MKNRAKCKACQSIIESLNEKDTVDCACGQISVSGGDKMGCAAIDWSNFLRVDDEGNIIVPTIREPKPITLDDLLLALDDMITRIEAMPRQAMVVSINHYDHVSLLILLSSIFRAICSEKSRGEAPKSDII